MQEPSSKSFDNSTTPDLHCGTLGRWSTAIVWGVLLAKPFMKTRLFIWPAAQVQGQCEVQPLHESYHEVVRWGAEKMGKMIFAT